MNATILWAWHRLTHPFRVTTYIHDRTKIRVRRFPWKLEITRHDPSAPPEHAIYILDDVN